MSWARGKKGRQDGLSLNGLTKGAVTHEGCESTDNEPVGLSVRSVSTLGSDSVSDDTPHDLGEKRASRRSSATHTWLEREGTAELLTRSTTRATRVTIMAREEARVIMTVAARDDEQTPKRPKMAASPARPAPIGCRMRT
jgi:hypothetical protein